MRVSIVVAAVFTLLSAEAGATSLRPCSHNAGGPLQAGDWGSSTYHTWFDVDGADFDFNVKSMAEIILPNGQPLPKYPPDEVLASLCIRYQLENEDASRTLDWFRWPDAGMPFYAYPIPPGQRSEDWSVVFADVLPKVPILRTEVTAFGDKKKVVEARLAVRNEPVLPDGQTQTVGSPINYLLPDDFPSELTASLEEAHLDVGPVQAVATPQDSEIQFGKLAFEFSPPNSEPVVLSSALIYRDGKFQINYTMGGDDSVEVSSPLFSVLAEYRPGPTVKDAITVAENLDSFIGSRVTGQGFDFAINSKLSEFEGYSVFIVKHPVTVRTDRGEACLLQPAYSPVPINISDKKCNLSPGIIDSWR